MNFRTCKYFLAVCEAGTINEAARKLYISQQSLSEHIRKLEKELGVQLFHRGRSLMLTEGGNIFYRAAADLMAVLNRMDAELGVLKGQTTGSLVIGCMDFGAPDFLPQLVEVFFNCMPDVDLQIRDIPPGELAPIDVQLLISSRELRGYHCENVFFDSLAVYVSDELLQRTYGTEWTQRRDRLRRGELAAIRECPFIRHRNARLEALAFGNNGFVPQYLPVSGSAAALTKLCISGQGALITPLGQVENNVGFPPAYIISNVPERIPTVFVCYRKETELSVPAQKFLDITRDYFKRRSKKNSEPAE